MIGGNLEFGMGDGEITNQYPAQENSVGNAAGNSAEQGGGEKAYLRKVVISWNG